MLQDCHGQLAHVPLQGELRAQLLQNCDHTIEVQSGVFGRHEIIPQVPAVRFFLSLILLLSLRLCLCLWPCMLLRVFASVCISLCPFFFMVVSSALRHRTFTLYAAGFLSEDRLSEELLQNIVRLCLSSQNQVRLPHNEPREQRRDRFRAFREFSEPIEVAMNSSTAENCSQTRVRLESYTVTFPDRRNFTSSTSFCLSPNTAQEEEEQVCMAKQLPLGSIQFDNGDNTEQTKKEANILLFFKSSKE